MAFDGIVISNIVSELKQKLTGGRISKIAQPEPEELDLTIKNKKDTYRLFLSANASLPLIYLTQEAGLSPMTAPNFCMLLRKHIGNARITDVTQPGLERIVRLELEHLDELGDLRQKSLVIEIMGKHSNIIFCDGTKIVDSIKHVSAAVSSVREVLPGRDYFIPNTTGKTNPLAADKTFFSSLFSSGKNIAAILSGNFTGISYVSAEEIVYRSGLDSSLAAEACTLEEQTRLWNAFSGVMDLIRTQQFSPCIAYDGNEPKEFSAFLLTGLTEYRLQTFDSISEVLYTYYNSRSAIARMRQKSADLRHLVQNLIDRTAKKADLQRRQLSDTDKREKYRIYGELLNAYGYDCPPDAKSYEVFNYYTDQMMTIPLDPTMTAKENAQKIHWEGTVTALSGGIRLSMTAGYFDMKVPLNIEIYSFGAVSQIPGTREEELIAVGGGRTISYLVYSPESELSYDLFAIMDKLELIGCLGSYYDAYRLLRTQPLSGRYVLEELTVHTAASPKKR